MSEYVPPPHVALSWAIRRLETDMPGQDPEWIAAQALRTLKASDRKDVLLHYVTDGIRAERRAEARRAERRAYMSSTKDDRKWRRDLWAEKARLEVEDPVEYRKRWPSLGQALDDFRAELRLELTAELLSTTFALGDGRTTTWGRATVADHKQRAAMLAVKAAGTLQTAALHEEAIAVIEAAGVSCLSEARAAGVAA